MKVAVAQICPQSADPGPAKLEKAHSTSPFPSIDANLLDAARAVQAAKAQGADLVLLPEYFCQGIVNDGRQVSHPGRLVSGGAITVADSYSI